MRSMSLSAWFISPSDSSYCFLASLEYPQFLHIFAWQKYWLMAVSSMVSAQFRDSSTWSLPRMRRLRESWDAATIRRAGPGGERENSSRFHTRVVLFSCPDE